MSALEPLESLYASVRGRPAPLPAPLAALYGRLDLPQRPPSRPAITGNFVSTLDGVTALNIPGVRSGGGEISGFDEHDRMVMGLLRAIAGAVIVGAGTLRSVPDHRWTPGYIYPPLRATYDQLRAGLGLAEPPLTVIVSARGAVDLSLPVFQSGETSTLIVTTRAGAERLDGRAPSTTRVRVVEGEGAIRAAAIVAAVSDERACDIILTEGGPSLMSDFIAEGLLDDLFLTLAPQVAGRDNSVMRPGFVDGALFAPDRPVWAALRDVRRGGSHLFLRYSFDSTARP